MKTLTRLFTPLLVVLMLITSASLAVARAAPDPAGHFVLCTGSGPVVLHVDENGDPVGAAHYCPDCAMTLLAAVASQTPQQTNAFEAQQIRFHMPSQSEHAAQLRTAQAREPPLA